MEQSGFGNLSKINLSGQDYNIVNLDNCPFEQLKTDFNGTEKGYSYAYTIGKYMLENFEKNKILEYVKYPDILKSDSDEIFERAKESFKSIKK